MKKFISEIVGYVHDNNGGGVPLYRALRTLICSSCGREIGEGTLFTRYQLPEQSLRLSPRCSECAPFNFPPNKRSSLIDYLLNEEPVTPETQGTSPAEVEWRRAEVEKRLGPALERSRRSRLKE